MPKDYCFAPRSARVFDSMSRNWSDFTKSVCAEGSWSELVVVDVKLKSRSCQVGGCCRDLVPCAGCRVLGFTALRRPQAD